MNAANPPRRVLWLAIGFILWASALLTMYAVQAIGCGYGWPQTLHRAALLLLAIAHLAVLGAMVIRGRRRLPSSQHAPRPSAFLEYVGVGATIAAFAATLFTFAPALFLGLCA